MWIGKENKSVRDPRKSETRPSRTCHTRTKPAWQRAIGFVLLMGSPKISLMKKKRANRHALDGTIFYCNPRFSETVQIESQNLIGTPFRNLMIEADQSAFEIPRKHHLLDHTLCTAGLKNARHQSEGGTLTTSNRIIPGFH
jgi:hypothetical protein